MIVHPEKYFERFAKDGVSMLSFHLEAARLAGKDAGEMLRSIKKLGPKAGLGAFYHLTDEWSLRADADATLGLETNCEMLYSLSVGVQYAF